MTVFTTHLTHTQITTQGHSITVQNNTTATSTEGKVVNKIQSTVTSVFNLTLLRRYMTETFLKRRKTQSIIPLLCIKDGVVWKHSFFQWHVNPKLYLK